MTPGYRAPDPDPSLADSTRRVEHPGTQRWASPRDPYTFVHHCVDERDGRTAERLDGSARPSRTEFDRRGFLAGAAGLLIGVATGVAGNAVWDWLKPREPAFGADVLTPERLRSAFMEIEHRKNLERDAIALAVNRKLHPNQMPRTTAIADKYSDFISERIRSPLPGGRSATLGSLLKVIHPDAGLPLDPWKADLLREALEKALWSDSFLYPEIALMGAGFLAVRMARTPSSSRCLDFVEWAAKPSGRPRSKEFLGYAAGLNRWLNNPSERLEVTYPLVKLIPRVEQRLRIPIDSSIMSDIEGSIFRAEITGQKPIKTWNPSEKLEYYQVTSYLADQWMQLI